jgi:hypothetical protein
MSTMQSLLTARLREMKQKYVVVQEELAFAKLFVYIDARHLHACVCVHPIDLSRREMVARWLCKLPPLQTLLDATLMAIVEV